MGTKSSELYLREGADAPTQAVSAGPDTSEPTQGNDFSEPPEPGEALLGSAEFQYEEQDADEPDEPEEADGPTESNRDLSEEPEELSDAQDASADVDDSVEAPEEPVEAPGMFRKDVFGGQELPSNLSPERQNAIEGLYSEAETYALTDEEIGELETEISTLKEEGYY